MSFTAPTQQEVAQERYGCSGTVWHVAASGGNDANAGDGFTSGHAFATIAHACAVALAGDVIAVSAGTFNPASTIVVPAGVRIVGAGIQATIVQNNVSGAVIFRVGSNVQVQDLWAAGTATPGASVFQYPFSDSTFTVTGVHLKHVKTSGDTDALYFTGTGSQVTVEDSFLTSNWDCAFGQNSGVTLDVRNTPCQTNAKNSASPNGNSTIQAVDGALVRLYGCDVSNVAGNTNASRSTRVINAKNSFASGSRIELHGGSVYMNVDGSTKININVDTGTTVVDAGCAYDRTQTNVVGTLSTLTRAGTLSGAQNFANSTANPATINGSGVGAFAATVTVTSNGTTPIAGATVTLSGTLAATAVTNASGVASFSLNTGSYTVSVTANGYSYAPTTQALDGSGHWSGGTGNLTITMTGTTVTPPAGAGQLTGSLTTKDAQGNVAANITLNFQQTALPAGETGIAYNGAIFTLSSNGAGLLQGSFVAGATYQGWTVKGTPVSFTVPTTGTTFNLPDVLGSYT